MRSEKQFHLRVGAITVAHLLHYIFHQFVLFLKIFSISSSSIAGRLGLCKFRLFLVLGYVYRFCRSFHFF